MSRYDNCWIDGLDQRLSPLRNYYVLTPPFSAGALMMIGVVVMFYGIFYLFFRGDILTFLMVEAIAFLLIGWNFLLLGATMVFVVCSVYATAWLAAAGLYFAWVRI